MLRAFSLSAALVLLSVATTSHAQQVPDSKFSPDLGPPAFENNGPLVLIDEGHANFHTESGRFQAFARLLRADGFVVRGTKGRVTEKGLASAKVLVIANALTAGQEWKLPIRPAFDAAEIAAIRAWVDGGGALLLIADHMPFPGAIDSLAAAFGLAFDNGFAFLGQGGDVVFSRANGWLRPHPIVDGLGGAPIDSVRSFMGTAFRADAPVETLLVLGEGTDVALPTVAWEFPEGTPRHAGAGLLQGAVRPFGRGRVAAFGEAAMFTAQLAGPQKTPMGMNSPLAPQNPRFVRAVTRWLAGVTP